MFYGCIPWPLKTTGAGQNPNKLHGARKSLPFLHERRNWALLQELCVFENVGGEGGGGVLCSLDEERLEPYRYSTSRFFRVVGCVHHVEMSTGDENGPMCYIYPGDSFFLFEGGLKQQLYRAAFPGEVSLLFVASGLCLYTARLCRSTGAFMRVA